MAVNVFIDGQEGTTGLRILERFVGRDDINIFTIVFITGDYVYF